jgi:hypothetical protein
MASIKIFMDGIERLKVRRAKSLEKKGAGPRMSDCAIV